MRKKFNTYIRQLSPHTKNPECFICFALEEDVNQWLETTFVPDLDQAGVKPLYCHRDLGPGKELNPFQALIRGADLVVVICTPLLKKHCDQRKKAPIGTAQEVRLAIERYNDPSKYETIFPIYLKGERVNACPSVFFEPILGTKFTAIGKSTESSVFTYYASAFELFGAMIESKCGAVAMSCFHTLLVEPDGTICLLHSLF